MLHALDARMRDASRDGLLVGMACNFAFVTQVFFAPAMTHVTPFMLSFTDMSYVFGALCAAFLLVRSRGSLPRMSMPLLWGLSLAMAVLFALYGLLITDVNDIASVNFATNVMFLVGGALFGVYLAYVIPLWLRVCAAHDPEEIVWTILLAGALGSVLVWFLGGMGPAPRLLVASDSMLLLGTYMLGRAVAAAQESVFSRSGESDGEQKLPVRLFAACFLMAFAFAIAISSAESRGASSSYATGTFFAPVLIACVCLLVLRGLTVSSLLNMAVPIITAVVMSASFFGVEPVLSFDLAVAGMFLFSRPRRHDGPVFPVRFVVCFVPGVSCHCRLVCRRLRRGSYWLGVRRCMGFRFVEHRHVSVHSCGHGRVSSMCQGRLVVCA